METQMQLNDATVFKKDTRLPNRHFAGVFRKAFRVFLFFNNSFLELGRLID